MTARDRDGGFAARPRDAESWIKTPDPSSSGAGEPPRPHSREQHRAWLLRRKLAP